MSSDDVLTLRSPLAKQLGLQARAHGVPEAVAPSRVNAAGSGLTGRRRVVQRRARTRAVTAAVGEPTPKAHVPDPVHLVIRSPGRSLERGVLESTERLFGRELGHVRLHVGEQPARSAEAIGVTAYAFGHHLVVVEREFYPASIGGRSLLAHEIAHVQQRAASPGAWRIIDHPHAELVADRAGAGHCPS